MSSYSWAGGSGGWGTTANWTGGIPNGTNADAQISAAGSYVVTLEAGKSYTVDSLTLNDGGATLDLLGTLTLGGTLNLLLLDSGVVDLGGEILDGTLDILGGSTLNADGGKLGSDAAFLLGGSATIDLVDNLTVAGASTFEGYILGTGELDVTGQATFTSDPYFYQGATLLDSGTITQLSAVQLGASNTDASITIAAKAVYDLNVQNSAINNDGTTFIDNSGLLEENFAASASSPSYDEIANLTNASTGTLDAVSLNSSFYMFGNNLLAGTIDGLGEIDVYSGTVTLESGVHFTAGTLGVGGGQSLVAAANITLGTQFQATYNAYVDPNGNTIALTGTGAVRSYVDGGGELIIAGSIDVGGLYLASNTQELVTGTAVQDGQNRLDYDNASTLASVLSIATTGTYDVTVVNSSIDYNGTAGTILNAGLFEANETTSSYFNEENNFTNATTGTISIATGDDISLIYSRNDLFGTIEGAGGLYIGDGSTTTLEAGLALTVAGLTVSDGNTDVILEANRTYAGAFTEQGSAFINTNGHLLDLTGSGNLNAYIGGGGTVEIAGTLNADFFLASGTEELVTGTALDVSGNTRLDYDNGSLSSILSIASTGTYDITAGNSQIDYNGTIGTVLNAGLFENTGTTGSYFNVEEDFTNASTGTIYVVGGQDISLIYGTDSLAGTIDGPGDIFIGNGVTATLAAGLVLDPGVLTFNDGDIILAGSRTITSVFDYVNSADIQFGGNTLVATNSGTIGGYATGPGVLDVTGSFVTGEYLGAGMTETLSGTEIQLFNTSLDYDNRGSASVLTIVSGGTYDITTDSYIYNANNNGNGSGVIVNSGLFEKTGFLSYSNIYTNFTNTSAGTLSVVANNQISLVGRTNKLAGTIAGAGDLYLGNGSRTTLQSGLSLKISNLTFSDGGTDVILTKNQSYASHFVLQSGASINLNGNTFSLGGTSGLDAYVDGPGVLNITGKADVSGFYLYATAALVDAGTITQDGGFQFGDSTSDSAHMTIAVGGVYDLLNNSAINAQGTAAITNNGLFEKNGQNGSSGIYARFNNTNTGTIDAVDGQITLYGGGSLGGKLAGAGAIDLAGGVFTLAQQAVVSVGTLYVAGGQLDVLTNHTLTDSFQELQGDVNLQGFTLSVTNAVLQNAYLSGPGTLNASGTSNLYNYYVTGGSLLEVSGDLTQQGNLYLGTSSTDSGALSITSTGTYDLADDGGIYPNGLASVVNAGLLEKTADNGISSINARLTNASTGIIEAQFGDIQLNGGGVINGTLTGSGEIDLTNSGDLLKSTIVTVGTLGIDAAPTLGSNLTYGGYFYLATNDALTLASHSLLLTGTASLFGGFEGSGTVTVSGTATVNLLALSGTTELIDTGFIDQINTLRFGYYYDGSSDTLAIAAGAIYEFQDDTGFQTYPNGTETETVTNAGLFEKIGDTGISEIQPSFSNTGTVLATAGTLQFDNPVNLAGGTLTGGTWTAAGGDILFESTTPLTVDAADIVLSGAQSQIFSGPSATIALAGSLNSIVTGGTLQLLKGATFEAPLADAGVLIVNGGTAAEISVVSGGVADIGSGGVAISTLVDGGGAEFVSAGGVATSATIAGGTLTFASGGIASGTVDFTGTGGELVFDSPTLPTNVISGFVSGDTIKLAGITYAAGATVTVGTAGVVSILDGGKTYSLHIAGATVGETDFQFSSGSLLTKAAAAKPKMKFLAPTSPAGAATASDPNSGAAVATLFTAVAPATPPSAAPRVATNSAASYAGGIHDLITVARGGIQALTLAHVPIDRLL